MLSEVRAKTGASIADTLEREERVDVSVPVAMVVLPSESVATWAVGVVALVASQALRAQQVARAWVCHLIQFL